jgi:hypothetical protein
MDEPNRNQMLVWGGQVSQNGSLGMFLQMVVQGNLVIASPKYARVRQMHHFPSILTPIANRMALS